MGTGGTLAGVADALREYRRDKDRPGRPHGLGPVQSFQRRRPARPGDPIAEGIGVSFVPGNLAGLAVDFSCRVDDDEALPLVYDLLKKRNFRRGSSGINIAGPWRWPGKWGRAIPSSPYCVTLAAATRASCSTREYLWKRKLPYPHWIAN